MRTLGLLLFLTLLLTILAQAIYATYCINSSEGTLTIATAEAYISSDGTSGWCSAESGKKYTTLTYYIGLYYEFSADNKVFDRGYILSLDPTVADILYKKNKPSGTHESVYSIARSYYSYDGTTWYLDASTGIGATIAGYCII